MRTDCPAGPIEVILHSWLSDPDLTLFCGHWAEGGMMELLTHGGARLSGPRYEPPFEGLRELRLDVGAHHVHLDLARLTHAWYVMTASVCYGWRPSFELRLTDSQGDPLADFGLGLSVRHPYAGGRLRRGAVGRYIRRATEHARMFPDSVSFLLDRSQPAEAERSDWDEIEGLFNELDGRVAIPGQSSHHSIWRSSARSFQA